MPIGWFVDVAEADNYFTVERLVTDFWDSLDESILHQKTKVLTNGYNRLYYLTNYSFPDYAHATALELVTLKIAQAEMAYYLALHLADEDRRKGLQAQAVIQAGIVKEVYAEAMLDEVPIPAYVLAIITPWYSLPSFAAVNISRDEEESAEVKIKFK